MANVVEVEIRGNDLTNPAADRATKNLKRLGAETKTLQNTFGQLGSIASTVSSGPMGQFINSIENVLVASRKMEGGLKNSRLAIIGIGAAVTLGVEVAFNEAIKYYERLEAEAQKRVSAMDAMIKAVHARQDLLDPSGAAERARQREAASQINLIQSAPGLDPQAVQSAIKEINQLKDLQNLKDKQAKFKALVDEDTEDITNRGANGNLAATRQLAIDAEDERYEKRLEQIKTLGTTEAQTLFAVEQARINHEQKLKAIDASTTKSRLSAFSNYAGAIGGIFGSLATIAEAQGKRGFKFAQALRYAEAIINTAAGVARALAEYQWPYSIVVGAAVAAAGAAQIAVIAGRKAPQAHSGLDYVPQDATYVLKKGEMVLDPGTSDQVRNAATNGGGGLVHLTINMDGNQIYKGVSQASRDGRLTIDARAVA